MKGKPLSSLKIITEITQYNFLIIGEESLLPYITTALECVY